MGLQQCEVCKEAQHKYKCPTCFLLYCSVACFKKHKEIPCEKPLPPVKELSAIDVPKKSIDCEDKARGSPRWPETSTPVLPERSFKVDDPSNVLNTKQLLSIVESNEIREFLENGELREMVRMVDSSKEPEIELDALMRGQVFSQFSDKILSILSTQEV